MFDLTATFLGTSEKTDRSQFQVALVRREEGTHPQYWARVNRFFDTKEDFNEFMTLLELGIKSIGGRLVLNRKGSHLLFNAYEVFMPDGSMPYSVVTYF